MLPDIPIDALSADKTLRKSKEVSVDKVKRSLSILFILIGIFFILSQVFPLLKSYFWGQSITQVEAKSNIIPVTQSFFKSLLQDQYYDPGGQFFEAIVKNSVKPNVKIDYSYSKTMYITIPGTPIKNIRITPNVPGSPKEVYEKALSKGVAHLKFTPLPGAGGVSIIYGHSGIPSLLSRHIKPKLIFTKLEDVKIGDTVLIKKDGKTLNYRVSARKIISPLELSLLHSLEIPPEKLVLITCWPSGIGTKRLVIIADRYG